LCQELVRRGDRAIGLDLHWPDGSPDDGIHRVHADVTKPSDLRAAFAAPEIGHLDHVFVNAGLVGPNQTLLDLVPADVLRMIEVNVLGAIFTVAEASRVMRAHGGGSILIVSSVLGIVGREGMSVYGASKAAVDSLARHAAMELAPHGIRVNSIAPGGVMTPAQRASFDDPGSGRDAEAEFARVPMKRFATVEEMARAMVDICTGFEFATGSTFVIDGGVSAQ